MRERYFRMFDPRPGIQPQAPQDIVRIRQSGDRSKLNMELRYQTQLFFRDIKLGWPNAKKGFGDFAVKSARRVIDSLIRKEPRLPSRSR